MLQSFCAMHPFWSNMCLTEAVMPEMQIICTICARNNLFFLPGTLLEISLLFHITSSVLEKTSGPLPPRPQSCIKSCGALKGLK